ncbi:MAG: PTS-dependent dihydroxyacetone kinase phosphotransferase subunit DhaM [Firmicutes bacterium]|nr:PTS-dependent dihydroxyacetone kinase phosphotransferase subunit DhaM [Bacillota bacterium]
MVGIVIVSHSHKLAQGVKELAEQVAGGKVNIATAGGLDDSTLGTSAERVLQAVSGAYGDDGVVILMDLGSAVMTAEVAVEMLPADRQRRVVLCPAPLVEGAVAAAAQAAAGASLGEVDSAARRAMELMKPSGRVADSGGSCGQPVVPDNPPPACPALGGHETARVLLTLRNRYGLHARPAAEFVRTASSFESAVFVRNLSKSGSVANAKSIIEVLTLGAESGHTIEVWAEGRDQAAALEALRDVVESGAGE